MPWCERCSRYLNPNTVQPDGTCPSCGRPVDQGTLRAGDTSADLAVEPSVAAEVDDGVSAPWHFWVMVVGVVVYLGWRLVEGGIWVFQHWF